SNTIAPALGFSSPATQASAVLLPQPDGPRRVRNSPSLMAMSRPFTAKTPPNCLTRRWRVTLAMRLSSPFEGAGQHAAHKISLKGKRYDGGRDDGQNARGKHRPVVVEAQLDQETGDCYGNCLRSWRSRQDQGEYEFVPADEETEDAGCDEAGPGDGKND